MTTSAADAAHAPDHIIGETLGGFQVTQALHVAARLGIVDALHQGPKGAADFAREVGAHEPSLRRLLRFLVTLENLAEDDEGRFTATALGELLRADHPQSMHQWALLLGGPLIWGPWGKLYEAMVTGQPAFNRVYGESFFTYLAQHPDDAAVFNTAMTSDTDTPPILKAYDFSDVTTIVDVGGGEGCLLRAILERYPEARGVLYDLPSVVTGAHLLMDGDVASRCEVVGGDMFASVPEGGDVYLLKRIIHDWSDHEAIRILRTCRNALTDTGKLLLIERIVDPTERSSDLMMLVLVTGRERTEAEFRDLLGAAGLTLSCVIPAGAYALIEGIAG